MSKKLHDEIIGKRVRVNKCEAREHGDNDGCVCHLIGHVVEIEKRYETPFIGTPSYHIKGMKYRVRRCEVTLIRNQQAVVREINGELVLDDPIAVAMISAVGKHNCRNTLELNADRVEHFKRRLTECGLTPDQAVIMLINVDDVHGGPLADVLLPQGHNWQEIRDKGEIPFVRGLALRDGIQEALNVFDKDAAAKLQSISNVAVVIIDYGVTEVFEV